MKKSDENPIETLGGKPRRKSRLLSIIVLLLIAVAIFLLGLLCHWGLRKLYRDNRAFLLTRIDIKTSCEQLRDSAEECLQSLQIQEEQVTLPSIDLRQLRDAIGRDARVASVEVQRLFPGTLQITIKPRIPVAILRFPPGVGQGDLRIDQEGIALPHDLPGNTKMLPIIDLPGPDGFVEGRKTENPYVLAFLAFLRECALHPNGVIYRPYSAHLAPANENLMCLKMEGNDPFVRGAEVIMPITQIPDHLKRLDTVVASRQDKRQTIGFINLAFNYIPVRARIPAVILGFPPKKRRSTAQSDIPVDLEGYVLPQAEAQGGNSPGPLPRILGLTNPEEFVEGQQCTNPYVAAFLAFLWECELRPSGISCRPYMARMDSAPGKMTIYLEANPPFVMGAEIIMSIDDIPGQVENLDRTIQECRSAGKSILSYDLTSQKISFLPN
ncbi:MAG: FtsQ-type POTRA domain-containing protein [Victivallales bacterium]|nr:FtsQ-type POTRA domain-containing protein [Victivallales bacterium]